MIQNNDIMTNLSIGELADIVGGRLRLGSMPPLGGALEPVGRLSVDSTAVRPGEVYWALPTDCNEACAAEAALARGAAGVIVAGRRVEPWAGTFSIEVDDTKWALWQLGRAVRAKLLGQVVAVVGELGKTTTAQMIDAVLAERFCGGSVADTQRHAESQHIGLALELAALDEEHDYTICELHGNCTSELSSQAQLCRPQIAVVTSPTEGRKQADTQRFADLLASLPEDGWAVLNGDDPCHRRLAAACKANTMWVGRGAHCDIVASDVRATGGELSFLVDGVRLRLPVWGRHQLSAALAACAVARIMGMPWEQIAQSMMHVGTPAGCCQVASCNEPIVIDDSRCNSPRALQAALEALRDCSAAERRIVVLGELAELDSPAAVQLGRDVVQRCGADRLLTCGRYAGDVVAGATQAGMPSSSAQACDDISAMRQTAALIAHNGDAVLVAGGPTAEMQAMIEALARQDEGAAVGRSAVTTKQTITNIFEAPPLVPVLRETSAALPPGLEQ